MVLLRLFLFAGVIIGGRYGLLYIFARSQAEIDAIKNQPRPDYYLRVDDTVQMSVINDQGELVMEISGETVTMSADQRKVVFTGGKAKYLESGQESLRMEAGEIEYDMQTEDFTLVGGLKIETKDGMSVQAPKVQWYRAKSASGRSRKSPSFEFPDGVLVTSRDGNRLEANYMQADRELTYMEYVGHVKLTVAALTDTEFITERQLTDPGALKLEDFETLTISAEQVIYDKRNEVLLATSRFYDRAFRIVSFSGSPVRVDQYQPQPQQVVFSKKEITIGANHLEAHVGRQWVECFGDINMVIPPAAINADDDAALKTMKRYETRISAGDLEYFWGRDYIICHTPTRVEQADRLAMADSITYWGDEKMVLLDGNINLVQGSGQWLFDDRLIDVEDPDQARIMTGYTELSAARAVMYLNNNDFVASGEVMMRQDNREATADTVVYQDEIKRLTAKGNVKFKDRDGQAFLCSALVYHNKTDFLEISGGLAAEIRLPAKFANDINRSIAEGRERPIPAEVGDPAVPQEPTRNPNTHSRIKVPQIASVPAASQPAEGLGLPTPPAAAESTAASKELVLQFGNDKEGGKPKPATPASKDQEEEEEG